MSTATSNATNYKLLKQRSQKLNNEYDTLKIIRRRVALLSFVGISGDE